MTNKVIHRTPKEVVVRWIEVLRSGEYHQTKGQLKKHSGLPALESFCCLGVLCDLNYKDGGAKWELEGIYFDNHDDSGFLPRPIQDYVMLKDSDVNTLIDMNDTKDLSFHQIARYIETTILPRHE